jgi:beta-glucosidase
MLQMGSCSRRLRLLACFGAILLATPLFAQSPGSDSQLPSTTDLGNAPFRNPDLPIDERVKDLVSRMTLEEKVSQMVHTASAIPRLGVPEYNWWSEGLHGAAREGYATVFPQAIGLAATFDPDLLHREADVIASEFRAKYSAQLEEKGFTEWYHGLTVWSPNINIFRDPRWGRGQETYGEDPFLTAQMGVAYVTGLQGNDPKYLKALATPKHFAVHSGPEPTRHTIDVPVSDHDLEDTYLPAFRATVTAGAGSVMCAYNAIDGKPACAQPMLLEEHLRNNWHFQGYVVSDCGAASDVSENHHYTPTIEEGMAAAVKAGMDIVCAWPPPHIPVERSALLRAAQKGLLSEQDLDRAVTRLFRARMKLGMFDPPGLVPYSKISLSDNDTAAHAQLALSAARESLVLLKNSNSLLPLGTKSKTIAVIGPTADSVDPLVGNYNGTPSHPVTILAGIRKRFSGAKILYAQGSSLIGPPLAAIPAKYLRSSGGHAGLTAEFFRGTELEGSPVLTRTDPGIDFQGLKGVAADLKENFSVRWTGTLLPPKTSDYEIGFIANQPFRIWLEDQLIGESGFSDTNKTRSKTIHLVAGHGYAIKVEFAESGQSGSAKLVWHEPGAGKDYASAVGQADVIVAVLGLTGELEGEEMPIQVEGFSGGDRTNLDLPRAQQQLLRDLVASGKPVVLVLTNGSALAINWADQHVPAILEAWYPGEAGGTAVAEALAGDFSPAGKLPVTFYSSVDQLPAFDDYDMSHRTYRYFSGQPLYPFGYGLSYTTFEYSNLSFDRNTLNADDDLKVRVDVKNAGKLGSDEVIEVYLTHPGVEDAPRRALAGFRRVHVDSGQTQTAQITIPNRNLSIVDQSGTRRMVPGQVQVWVGGGQPVTRTGMAKAAGISGTVTIEGEAVLPK